MRAESLDKIITKTAKELNIPKSVVKEVIYHKYQEFRDAIKNMTHPEILDEYFGRYKVIPKRLLESDNYKELQSTAEVYINRRKQKHG